MASCWFLYTHISRCCADNGTYNCECPLPSVWVPMFWTNKIKLCALLGYYGAWFVKSLPTFRYKLSVLSSMVRNWILYPWPLKIVPKDWLKTSVMNYHCTLHNILKEHRYYLLRGRRLQWRRTKLIIRLRGLVCLSTENYRIHVKFLGYSWLGWWWGWFIKQTNSILWRGVWEN
jgi:hypothetical protein